MPAVAESDACSHNQIMNKWLCPHCNEELLGAVNRCWKCGARVTEPEPVFDAEVIEPVEEAEIEQIADTATFTAVMVERLTAEELSLAMAKEPPRRGSPFAFDTKLSSPGSRSTYVSAGPYRREEKEGPPASGQMGSRPLQANYKQNQAAIGGVVAALVLGVISIFVLPMTVFGIIPALLGVLLGIYGLYSDRRAFAIIALLLCCLATAAGLYFIAFATYELLIDPSLNPLNQPSF